MLTIRRSQMFMRIKSEEGFVAWYVNEFMPDNLPEFHETLSASSLTEMVRSGRRIALTYGFSEPDAIAHFVTLMWLAGPTFMDFPGFSDVLARKDLTEAERINALYSVDRDQAAEAIARADDRGWWRVPP